MNRALQRHADRAGRAGAAATPLHAGVTSPGAAPARPDATASTRWPVLTREARDTLFLLAVLAWTLLPQLGRVPLWCSGFALGALAWRGLLAWRGARLPPGWLRLLMLAGLIALAARSYHNLLGKEAGVALLVALAGLKTLELHARRDIAVVFGLGLFLVLANFLYSQSLATALVMLVAVSGLLTALVLTQMRAGRPSLWGALGVVLRHAVLGAPLVALLFLLFPRIAPLWGVPGEAGGRTGLSDQLELGSVAELASDDALALRVRFLADPRQAGAGGGAGGGAGAGSADAVRTAAPPPGELIYFRGPVLSRIDPSGNPLQPRWRAADPLHDVIPPSDELGPLQFSVAGTPVNYEMTLEPLRVSSVPLLELTAEAPELGDAARAALPGLQQHDDLQWSSQRPLNERVRLLARAWPTWRLATDLSPPAITAAAAGPVRGGPSRHDLALPAASFLRTRAWVQQALVGKVQVSMAGSGASAAQPVPGGRAELASRSAAGLAADGYALALLAHIRNAGFVYTLSPGPVPPGVDALDDFWLDRKQGFCEHYAVAFVVALRSLGVPARIVTGYQGGHVNPVDGVFEVRQSDAHAWAEYWRDGTWVRADPTAAVAPERVRQTLRLRPPLGLVVGTLGQFDPAMAERLARLRQLWSAADHRWNQWVLDHDQQRQLELLRRLGWAEADSIDLLRTLLIGLALIGLAGALWAGWDGRRALGRPRRADPWLSGWSALQQRLREAGLVDLPATATPGAAARAAQAYWGPTEAGALVQALEALERLRYAAPIGAGTAPTDRAGHASQRRLKPLLRQARHALAPLNRLSRLSRPVRAVQVGPDGPGAPGAPIAERLNDSRPG
ncbi:MAG: hypothetical protein RIQ60_2563 [Pseudomonadota bacterium]|jgi:hypothetical protein